MKTGVTTALLVLAIGAAAAADSVVADVEHRLFWEGAQSANAYLRANKGIAMAAFNRHTAGCEPKALELAVQLRRASRGDVALAHGEALRAAAALCPARLLGAVPLSEIALFCRTSEAWGPAQAARELRRQIASIDADPALRATPHGQACRAAYVHELETTRVVVRRVDPAGSRAAR